MNVLGWWHRLSQDVSRSLYALQMRCHPAPVNELYENGLLECFHLDACGGRAWTAGTYLEKLLPAIPGRTRGHIGNLVSGLGMIGDAVSYGDPGTLTRKRSTGVERRSVAHEPTRNMSFERGAKRRETRIRTSL